MKKQPGTGAAATTNNRLRREGLRCLLRKLKREKKKQSYIWLSVLSLVLFFFIWWLFTEGSLGTIKENVLPGPVKVLRTLIDKFSNRNPDGATMQMHLWASLKITLIGYIIGCLVGVPLGIFMGWYEKADMFINPIFDFIRPIPGIAWTPLFILLFGIGMLPKVIVIALATFGPALVNTYTGIKQTKEVHIWVGQTFGASKFEILRKIAIPSSIPFVLTGMRVGLGVAWSTIIGAEMLAATAGLGYLINLCRGIYRPDIIIAAMICVGLIGAALGYLLTLLERQLMKGEDGNDSEKSKILAETGRGCDILCGSDSDLAACSHESHIQPGDARTVRGSSKVLRIICGTDRKKCDGLPCADHVVEMGGRVYLGDCTGNCTGSRDGLVSEI